MRLLNCKHSVYEKLKNNPDTRDCDLLLFSEIVVDQLEENIKEMKLVEFLNKMRNKEFFHFESIRRVRQKLQETTPSLRGELWDKRHRLEGYVTHQLDMFEEDNAI